LAWRSRGPAAGEEVARGEGSRRERSRGPVIGSAAARVLRKLGRRSEPSVIP
jgi:hypothetical protein